MDKFNRDKKRFFCCRESKNKETQGGALDELDYDSGESDLDDSVIVNKKDFETMTKEEKEVHIKDLWSRAYHKARGASILLDQLEALRMKIEIFGR